jgi:hypothetical protein
VPSQSSAEAETPLHSGVIIDGDDVERVLLMAARGERDEEKNETAVTARRQSGLHRSRESISVRHSIGEPERKSSCAKRALSSLMHGLCVVI